MTTNSCPTGVSNAGSGDYHPARSRHPLVNHYLSGVVRWLDRDLKRIVVAVQDTDGHGGALRERQVTVDLEAAHLLGGDVGDLLPGIRVVVRVRLPRGTRLDDARMVVAHAVTVEG